MAVVPPVGGPYGLKIYVCPKCDRSRDMLIPAHDLRPLSVSPSPAGYGTSSTFAHAFQASQLF